MRLSILDLAYVPAGGTPADALRNTLDLAQQAEQWGYHRFWLAERHNLPGFVTAATAVAIGFVAAGTRRIRVGAGAMVLRNHAPLALAEQFGMLETLYPGRIDLGLDAIQGFDPLVLQALGGDPHRSARFPEAIKELQEYFEPPGESQPLQAVPGAGLRVPLWIYGSSLSLALLAGQLGLPHVCTSHSFSYSLRSTLPVYRESFIPVRPGDRSYAAAGVNVVVADTDAHARRLFTSAQQQFVNLHRGWPGKLPPPIDDIEAYWTRAEKVQALMMLGCAYVGSPETVRCGLRQFIEETGVDELLIVSAIYDHTARLRSYQLLAEAMGEMNAD